MAGLTTQDEAGGHEMERQGRDKGIKSEPLYLSVIEVSQILKITPECIFSLILKGSLPSLVQIQGRRMFLRSEIDKLVEVKG